MENNQLSNKEVSLVKKVLADLEERNLYWYRLQSRKGGFTKAWVVGDFSDNKIRIELQHGIGKDFDTEHYEFNRDWLFEKTTHEITQIIDNEYTH